MTGIALRLERVVTAELDGPLVALGALRLVRSDDGLSMEVAEEMLGAATAMLARAGMRIAASGSVAPATSGLVPGTVPHLEPIVAAGVVDALRIRALDEGEATARLSRRSLLDRRADDVAVHLVLSAADRAFVWTRTVFARPRVIRTLRGVRPVVFDRGALERADDHLAFVGASALTRWAT